MYIREMHCDKMHHTWPKGHLLHCVMITISYNTCIICSFHGVGFSLPIYMILLDLDTFVLQKFVARKLNCIMFGPACFCIDVGANSILTANVYIFQVFIRCFEFLSSKESYLDLME